MKSPHEIVRNGKSAKGNLRKRQSSEGYMLLGISYLNVLMGKDLTEYKSTNKWVYIYQPSVIYRIASEDVRIRSSLRKG